MNTECGESFDIALAVLKLEPGELSARFGLVFTEGVDDLDVSLATRVQVDPATAVFLMRYNYQTTGGTRILGEAARARGALSAFLHRFGLAVDDLSWVSDLAREELA